MTSKTKVNDGFFLEKGFLISTDQSLLDIQFIHHFLDQESYWAKGIPLERLETAIKNSLCFGIYHQNKQIGFARVITDFAVFAYLADVFITPEYRKQGLSKWLIQTILQHQDLQDLKRWLLATADAQELYRGFGFEKINNPDNYMQIFNPYIYSTLS
jgi:N-acetylglutamate synthase-like GNAT family acetyltransferase